MCIIQGLSLSEVGQRLSIPKGTLATWVARAKRGEETFMGNPGTQTLKELSEENAKLRKEVEEARMERDILKKAVAFFAKEPQRGTRS